jgi:hypothetical protein
MFAQVEPKVTLTLCPGQLDGTAIRGDGHGFVQIGGRGEGDQTGVGLATVLGGQQSSLEVVLGTR